jgi:peptidoglycan/xylan/chitin deacetylase (PgdA/CDA1 family)
MPVNRKITVVMYHYVRDLERSRFPAIKGLSIERFKRQLDHIQTHYTPITVEMLLETLRSAEQSLPPNPVLLTFDDGYGDHFANVFPMLDTLGIQGCFFPPAQAILEHKVLDVNKIHFVLASGRKPDALLDRVLRTVHETAPEYPLQRKEFYLEQLGGDHRYDSREVVALKRLLQRDLPEPIRQAVVRALFAKYVTADETAFACELYMSLDQIACMHRHGMHFGSHGYSHAWLNHMSPEAQVAEIDRSLDFLRRAGCVNNEWTMCYPYGGFNESLLNILRERKCRAGFAVDFRVADLDTDDFLALPRVDTNDLPS